MTRDARRAAFEILRRVEERDAWASILLRATGADDPRTDALTTEIVYGVLRRRLWIDHVIAAFSSRPIARIDPDLLQAIRIAVYQILYLDRVPAHAAVDEAVKLARARAPRKPDAAAGFANAVLRSLLREPARVPVPPEPASAPDPAAALALSRSFPEWATRRWVARLGLDEATRLLDAMNGIAHAALRVSPGRDVATIEERLGTEGVRTRPSRWVPGMLVVVSGTAHRTRAFEEGDFYIQDEASCLAALLAGARPGLRILDACAAPGGKSLVIEDGLASGGMLVAADRQPARLARLRENRARLGRPPGLLLAADMARAAPLRDGVTFDVVVVDAPCSGTGVIRRHPELRYRFGADALERIGATQSALLAACAPRVRAGGAIVYAVCSMEPEEGPERVAAFLEEHPGFRVEDPRPFLPAAARVLVERSDPGEALVTRPHHDGTDGFYAVRMVRASG